jgi:very-short-patch-repair endonuclease
MTIKCEYKTGDAVCGKILSCQSSLRRHIKATHEKIKTHVCVVEGCEWAYTSKCDLARHVKYKHTIIKEFKCSIGDCKSEFAWATDLKDHIKFQHNNIRNFICTYETCDEKYHTNGKLQRHINSVHLNLNPYMCDWENCELKFPSPENMRRHVNGVHLDIRNYPCPNENCDYIFHCSTHLKSHINICTNGEVGSSGEVKTKHILIDLGINFRFDSSYELMGENGKYLRWDFIILTDDDPLFIEVDGEQHFSPQRFGNTTQEDADVRFITQKRRDKLKNEYCIDNGYLLLRVRNNLIDKKFKKIITEFIEENLVF